MKVGIVLSGGLDSTTLLGMAIDQGHRVQPFHFTYGSKHNKFEREAVISICKHYCIDVQVIDVESIFQKVQSNLLKSGGDIPEGHYQADSMKLTVVPGRNLVLTSIAASIAQSMNLEELYLGIHSGDHAIYPDCRPEWFDALCDVITAQTEGSLTIKAPFLHDTKIEILQAGIPIGVPYHLTRTCYKLQTVACGRCGSCQERLLAWKEVGMEDPLIYESRDILPTLEEPSSEDTQETLDDVKTHIEYKGEKKIRKKVKKSDKP